jgi:predicted methyltransferase
MNWRCARVVLHFLAAAGVVWVTLAQDRRSESEWGKRDTWQRPVEVMDALGIGAGSAVADIGAGRGYFTMRLAERVGPQGRVYAVDIDEGNLGRLRDQAERKGWKQVVTIHGSAKDPKIAPESVQAILVVNAYHEMRDYDAMLQGMWRGLKPCGLLGIIDSEAPEGRPREDYFSRHDIPEALVRADAERNGFRFVAKKPGFRNGDGENWYFVIFEKPSEPCHPVPSGQ